MIPGPQLMTAIRHLTADPYYLHLLSDRRAEALAAVQAQQVSPGVWSASIASDLITAVTVVVCLVIIAGTVLIGMAMTQVHNRVRELDKQDSDNRAQTCSPGWHQQMEERNKS